MKILIDDKDVKELLIPKVKHNLPMPVVDEEGDITIPGIVEREKPLGRVPGSENISQLKKELIALDANTSNMSQKEIGKVHGVTQEAVSHLSRGYDRTNIDDRKVNDGVKEIINDARQDIAAKATEKLLRSLEIFEPGTLDQKELPSAALKLAGVMEKVKSGFNPNEGKNGPQFIVFSPRVRPESSYEVIDVSEA